MEDNNKIEKIEMMSNQTRNSGPDLRNGEGGPVYVPVKESPYDVRISARTPFQKFLVWTVLIYMAGTAIAGAVLLLIELYKRFFA
ncbi:hypothetical protein Dip510_002023 [Elusimicrobium posterum]|uniref:hypothetical protein n=1 Tax=Elusimicrobium posterum TaxID=3116653 RepID=UPI003C780C23